MDSAIFFSVCLAFQLATGVNDSVGGPESLPAVPALDESMEILTRGPVHEAFAEQVPTEPRAGIVVPKQPPVLVDEIPPDLKPEGDDVIWIPGYWFWDDERADFLWVSGVWRNPPPGRRWVPGYWQAVDGSHQWVSGFWASNTVEAFDYREPPPRTLESGPSSPSLSANHFWIPGHWAYETNRYRWRPGFWCLQQTGWIWVCGRYLWTPRGCLYIDGYWDFALSRRGYLFAPVYFRRSVYMQAGYHYRPTCWVGYDSLLLNLFIRPRYHHYYFGDYYASVYRRQYQAGYSYFTSHRGYDPLYTYYSHYYRSRGIDYIDRVRRWHDHYASHRDLRPARTWSAERNRHLDVAGHALASHQRLGRDLRSAAVADRAAWHATRLGKEKLATVRRRAEQIQHLADLRRRIERPGLASRVGHPATTRHVGETRTRLVLPMANAIPPKKVVTKNDVVARYDRRSRQLAAQLRLDASKQHARATTPVEPRRGKLPIRQPTVSLPTLGKPASPGANAGGVPHSQTDRSVPGSVTERLSRRVTKQHVDRSHATPELPVVVRSKFGRSARERLSLPTGPKQVVPSSKSTEVLRYKTRVSSGHPTPGGAPRSATRQAIETLRAQAASSAVGGHRYQGPDRVASRGAESRKQTPQLSRPAGVSQAAALSNFFARRAGRSAHAGRREMAHTPAIPPRTTRGALPGDVPHANRAATKKQGGHVSHRRATVHTGIRRAAPALHERGERSASKIRH